MLDLNEARRTATERGWLSLTPPAFQQSVLKRTSLRTLKIGETLHYAGDDSIGIYGILTGRLQVELAGENTDPFLIHVLRPGAWIGEGPSITGRPRVVTLTAATACELLFLPQTAASDIVMQDPASWRFFVIPLQWHFETALGAIGDMVLRDYNKRIVASLLRLGGLRTGEAPPRGRIEIEVSQEEIAVMTNVARVTAGLVLRKLAKAGLIELGYGQITLLAPARLQTMMEA